MPDRPLLTVTLAFIGGVAFGAWLPQEPAAWGWAAAGSLSFWAALLAARALQTATRVAAAVFVVVGIFRVQCDLAPLYEETGTLVEGDAVAAGRIARPAESRDGETVLHLADVRLRHQGATVLLRLPLQTIVPGGGEGYSPGDLLVARGKLRTIRGDRNLGWFPGPVSASGKRHPLRLVVASAVWTRRVGHDPGRGPSAAVLRWRSAADGFWKRRHGAAGQILNSLTTGERAGIPAEIQQAFLRSGLTHLLAISGMNVAFLAALVYLLLSRGLALMEPLALRVPVQPLAAALTLPSLWFFMLFSGSQIPVGRAALSSAAGLAAVVLWRRVNPADACALAASLIVAGDPPALFSASFQLSFAATTALILVAPRLRISHPTTGSPASGKLCRLRRAARALFVVSLAASAVTAPLVAFHFQQVSIVGPLANLVAVPYTGFVVLPTAWLTLVAAALSAPAGELAAAPAGWSAELLAEIASWFALPAWAVLRTARPPPLLTFLLVVLACLLLPRPTRRLQGWCVGACCAAAIAGGGWAVATHRQELLVVALDVGQGLAAAVVLPGGDSLLYDAGPRWRDYDAGERIVVPALRRLGVERLGTLVISHPHPDHDGGVEAVLRELPVGRTWRADGPEGMKRGEEHGLGGGVRARVLNPRQEDGFPTRERDANDRSLAVLLSWRDAGVIFTGDAGPVPAEGIARAAAPLPPAVVLQAPHHGGSPAACRLLAASLRPEASVISVGRNTYGHPKAGAVAALGSSGRVLRTDREGAVFFHSDGTRFTVRTWRELTAARTWTERMRWLVAGR